MVYSSSIERWTFPLRHGAHWNMKISASRIEITTGARPAISNNSWDFFFTRENRGTPPPCSCFSLNDRASIVSVPWFPCGCATVGLRMGVLDCFMRKMMQRRGDCKIVIRSLRERKDRYSGIFNFWSAGIGTQGMKIFLD